jgi:DNA invertase Pin-like site-specific DNA recombinase
MSVRRRRGCIIEMSPPKFHAIAGRRRVPKAWAIMEQMVGAFAEFERAMLRERTRDGLEAARRDGRIGGRRPKLTPQPQAEIIRTVSRGDKTAAADAARLFSVHPATVARLLARAR